MIRSQLLIALFPLCVAIQGGCHGSDSCAMSADDDWARPEEQELLDETFLLQVKTSLDFRDHDSQAPAAAADGAVSAKGSELASVDKDLKKDAAQEEKDEVKCSEAAGK